MKLERHLSDYFATKRASFDQISDTGLRKVISRVNDQYADDEVDRRAREARVRSRLLSINLRPQACVTKHVEVFDVCRGHNHFMSLITYHESMG